jgi:phage terminase Nu1 subunit (DNA packaging protein)
MIMKHQLAGIMLSVLFWSAVSAPTAQASQSADWVPVDQDVWTIFTEEPQAHLARAQEDLSSKDTKAAATEIRKAGTFLKIQQKRLAVSSRQLNELAKDIDSGKVVSAKEVEDTFNRAVSVLDYHQTLIPVMEGADTLYSDETDYHLAQAKSRLNKKDNKAAAGDIRKAAAYIKLKAVHAGEKAKSTLLASAAELGELARKVDEGESIAAKDLEKAFKRAHAAVGGVL